MPKDEPDYSDYQKDLANQVYLQTTAGRNLRSIDHFEDGRNYLSPYPLRQC